MFDNRRIGDSNRLPFLALPGGSRRGVRAGRRNATGNRVGGLTPPRGFESLPLRQDVCNRRIGDSNPSPPPTRMLPRVWFWQDPSPRDRRPNREGKRERRRARQVPRRAAQRHLEYCEREPPIREDKRDLGSAAGGRGGREGGPTPGISSLPEVPRYRIAEG